MRFCTYCGAKLAERSVRCPECGRTCRSASPTSLGRRDRPILGDLKGQLRQDLKDDLASGLGLRDPGRDEAGSPLPFQRDSEPRNEGNRGRQASSRAHFRLNSDVLPYVKNATVFIEVGSLDSSGRFQPHGSGSGFVISADGWIVTNRHVVQDAQHVLAVFGCGTPAVTAVLAEVACTELPVDLALLRADVPSDPSVLRVGDSNALAETDPVWALGFPLGTNLEAILNEAGYRLNQNGPDVSVREGTITSVRHDSDGRVKLLEHNCNIAPGNSGGPLMNHQGLVVGVNTLGLGTVEPAEVTNFAIPSRVLAEFIRAVGGPHVDL